MADNPFTFSVEAGFSEDGIWILDARLQWCDGVVPADGSQLLGEGRLALLERIAREAMHGRALGAKSIQLHLNTGDICSDMVLGVLPPRLRNSYAKISE